jgi:ADP-dependent NAD(P)H-hydrate dehydratase / NAD(P)H-hydrate epimerase
MGSGCCGKPEGMNATPLLTAEETRRAEAAAIAAGTPASELMNHAGRQLAAVISSLYAPCETVFLCGSGNNGGDGFVAAHILREHGWNVRVLVVGESKTPEAKAAREAVGMVENYNAEALAGAALVVDALFGTGLSKPVEGVALDAVNAVNALGCPVVAVDVPSGIDASSGTILGAAIRATHTVTFATAKCGHYLLPAKACVGKLHVMDIGISREAIAGASARVFLNSESVWKNALPSLAMDAHKYTRGATLTQGGALASCGAAKLAATAALKMGSGLSSVICDDVTLPIYAASLTAVMTKPANTLDAFYKLVNDRHITALAIGCGAGVTDATAKRTITMLDTKKPCVVDADALTVFAQSASFLLESAHEHTVLTPHMGEFKRLFGAQEDKLAAAARVTEKFKGVLVLKGNDTIIAQAGKPTLVNHNAPATLATAGSGDVLTGMIAGLIAQGMAAYDAAAAAVWLHAETANQLGRNFTAEELVAAIRLPTV